MNLTLKSTLIKKRTVLAHFGDNLDFKGNLDYSPVNSIHSFFRMSYSWVVKRLWMISPWTILLSRLRGVNCSLEDFKILMLYHRSRGVPLFVLLSKLRLCKWEVISLIGQEDSMIFQNLMIQWNPTFVPIDIVELFLLVTFRFLLIFHIALIFERSSDWIPSLNMLALSFLVKKRSSQS